jgi:hypothetical protein
LNRKSFQMTLPMYARSQTQAGDRWELFARWLAAHQTIPRAVPAGDLYTNLVP